jgi:hypothetical protein
MSDTKITNELAGDAILAVYNAEKSRRAKLSAQAVKREARKREERARVAAMNAELDAALDGVEPGCLTIDRETFDGRAGCGGPGGISSPGTYTIRSGETQVFKIGDTTVTLAARTRHWDRDAIMLILGLILGMAVFATLRVVCG